MRTLIAVWALVVGLATQAQLLPPTHNPNRVVTLAWDLYEPADHAFRMYIGIGDELWHEVVPVPPGATTWTVTVPAYEDVRFTLTAVSPDGLESEASNIVITPAWPRPPEPPEGFTVVLETVTTTVVGIR